MTPVVLSSLARSRFWRQGLPALLTIALAACAGVGTGSQGGNGDDGSDQPGDGTDTGNQSLTPSDRIQALETTLLPDGRTAAFYRIEGFRCFQPNSQTTESTFPENAAYVADGWGDHEFMVVYPAGADPAGGASVNVMLYLKGGGYGWVDLEDSPGGELVAGTAWGTRSGTGVHWDFLPLSTQWWNRKHTVSDLLGAPPLPLLPSQVGHPDSFINRFRSEWPDWAIVYPSYCSRDLYLGRGEPGPDGTRYGFDAVTTAISYLDATHGIDQIVVAGNSSGGIGAAVMARDLPDAVGIPVAGAVVSSAPVRAAHWAALHDADKATGGWRQVTTATGEDAWIDCAEAEHDYGRGITHIAAQGLDLAADIEAGRVGVPIFHVWNTRDNNTLCGDADFSARRLHGPVADAIDAHNPGGASVNHEVCIGTETVCLDAGAPTDGIDACAATTELTCAEHGLMTGDPALQNLIDTEFAWLEERTGRTP